MTEKEKVSLAEYGRAGNPFLSAKNFRMGEKLTARVVKYEGISEFELPSGDKIVSPQYVVEVGKDELYSFRLTKTNAKILLDKGFKDFTELVGKNIELVVVPTNKGNTFSIVEVK
jgi:hypothetical protein